MVITALTPVLWVGFHSCVAFLIELRTGILLESGQMDGVGLGEMEDKELLSGKATAGTTVLCRTCERALICHLNGAFVMDREQKRLKGNS